MTITLTRDELLSYKQQLHAHYERRTQVVFIEVGALLQVHPEVIEQAAKKFDAEFPVPKLCGF